MPTLSLPGATLDYTTTNTTGPPIILVPGAPGSSTVFRHLVPPLSLTHTVTTYSRRGLSRSTLHGPQDYAQRLSTDADDLAALITAVASSPTPATVFGTSSGALVALRFLTRHPTHPGVSAVVAHEPPAVAVLPDAVRDERGAQHRALYELYRAAGAPHAVETFAAVFSADVGGGALAGEREKAGIMELLDQGRM
ncbi:hypothetical protein SLS58_010037 [Diplodia intermedia]|uniref:AB hydrolase-1 domain-containing protein n=1 Tax=Diplodia intermedia TaxID=856260 RepID=A0ABR3T998_9PEZI